MSSQTDKHQAAVLTSRGKPLKIEERPTPKPGPKEIIIEVKSVALNPVDHYQQKFGFPAVKYPAILGSDVAGIIVDVGEDVSELKIGMRVTSYATSFFTKVQDNGAFQSKVLVNEACICPLPDNISFNDASLLPMSVIVSWLGYSHIIGIPKETKYTEADKKGMLVWGAGGSIGTGAVQVAHLMGFKVFATASPKHNDYLKSLGAAEVFDYNDKDVESKIVKAVKDAGVTIDYGFFAVGNALTTFLSILKQTKSEPNTIVKVALAPFLFSSFWWKIFPTWGNAKVTFIVFPEAEDKRNEFAEFVFRKWLKEKLANGEYKPSPKVQLVEGGMNSLQSALDTLGKGVSGVKLVLNF